MYEWIASIGAFLIAIGFGVILGIFAVYIARVLGGEDEAQALRQSQAGQDTGARRAA